MKQNFYAWAALVVRSFSALLLLTIASNSYSQEEIAIWLVILVIGALQAVFDFGISPTVMRFTIYALRTDTAPNVELNNTERERLTRLRRIPFVKFQSYVRNLYLLLAVLVFGMTVLLGLFALWDYTDGPTQVIELLIVSAVGNAAAIFQLNYATYLNARKQVTSLKKAEALIGVGTLLISLVLILMQTHLIVVFAMIAFGKIVMTVGLRWVAKRQSYETEGPGRITMEFLAIIFPQTLRAGIAIAASTGVLQISSLLLVRTLDPTEATAYLFGLRALQTITQFSNVPFYTRLPYLISHYVDGQRLTLLQDAQKLILFSLALNISLSLVAYISLELTFEAGWHNLGVIPPFHLAVIVSFLSFERLASMYSQIRSLNNRIDWHTLNITNGAFTLVLLIVLLPTLGPVGYLIGVGMPILVFYLPYSSIRLLLIFPDTARLVRSSIVFCVSGLLLFWTSLSLIYMLG